MRWARMQSSCLLTELALLILRVPGEEFHDGPGKEVVAVARDHVAGAAHVDEVDVGKACNELVGPFLGDEVAHLTADKEHGYAIAKNRLDRVVHAVDVGHFDGRKRCRAVDELRIPMPVPPTVAVPQIRLESVQIRWSRPVR